MAPMVPPNHPNFSRIFHKPSSDKGVVGVTQTAPVEFQAHQDGVALGGVLGDGSSHWVPPNFVKHLLSKNIYYGKKTKQKGQLKLKTVFFGGLIF